MAPAVLAAIINAAASIGGNFLKGKSADSQASERRSKSRRLDAWYDRERNSNPLDRVSNRAILEKARQDAARLVNRQAGAAAVSGATPEAQAASKAAIADSYANAQTKLAAAESARQDRIEENYLKAQDSLANERIANEGARQNAINTALQGAAGVLSSVLTEGKSKSDSGSTGTTNAGKVSKVVSNRGRKNIFQSESSFRGIDDLGSYRGNTAIV